MLSQCIWVNHYYSSCLSFQNPYNALFYDSWFRGNYFLSSKCEVTGIVTMMKMILSAAYYTSLQESDKDPHAPSSCQTVMHGAHAIVASQWWPGDMALILNVIPLHVIPNTPGFWNLEIANHEFEFRGYILILHSSDQTSLLQFFFFLPRSPSKRGVHHPMYPTIIVYHLLVELWSTQATRQ